MYGLFSEGWMNTTGLLDRVLSFAWLAYIGMHMSMIYLELMVAYSDFWNQINLYTLGVAGFSHHRSCIGVFVPTSGFSISTALFVTGAQPFPKTPFGKPARQCLRFLLEEVPHSLVIYAGADLLLTLHASGISPLSLRVPLCYSSGKILQKAVYVPPIETRASIDCRQHARRQS